MGEPNGESQPPQAEYRPAQVVVCDNGHDVTAECRVLLIEPPTLIVPAVCPTCGTTKFTKKLLERPTKVSRPRPGIWTPT